MSTKLQVTGMALLLASMSLVTFVVGRLIFDDTVVGVLFGGTTAATGVALWYLLPRAGSPTRAAERSVREDEQGEDADEGHEGDDHEDDARRPVRS